MDLKRSEIIALVNVFGKLSESLTYYEHFLRLEQEQEEAFQ